MRFKPSSSARPLKAQYTIAAFVPALIVVLSISGFVWAQKPVTVVVDGRTVHTTTKAASVGDVLSERAIATSPGDIVSPSASTRTSPGMTIVVRHAVPVSLQLSGSNVTVRVVGTTVADALVAAGVDPESTPRVKPSLPTRIKPGMTIKAPDVFVRLEQRETTLTAATVIRRDPSLPSGARAVATNGAPGRQLRVYRVMVVGGQEGTPTLSASAVLVAPKPKVVLLGSGDGFQIVAAGNRTISVPAPPRSGARMRVLATAYCASEPGGPTTSTGRRATYGVVAVDPRVIPMGTRLYIPGYGYAIAADVGGAINGHHIDLCFDSMTQVNRWGSRHVTITICK